MIVLVAVAGAAVFFTYKSVSPPTSEELTTIGDQLGELEDYLNLENQDYSYGLSEIAGDWG